MTLSARQTADGLRGSSLYARSKFTNDLLALASGQSPRMRRYRDLVRWAAREIGDEKMASESTRAQVIALVNAIIASEELATNPKPEKPYAAIHLAQTIASLLDRLGLDDAKRPDTPEPPRRGLLALMGEGGDDDA